MDDSQVAGRRDLVFGAVLLALTLAVYAGVSSFQYVSVDDPAYVTYNVRVGSGLNWENVVWAFTTTTAANWHPVTWLSLMLDVELFGVDARAQHVVNLLLHSANVILLYALLVSGTGARGRSFVVAALFAVHPLHVESVAWVSERKDVLSALFWFLTMGVYMRYARRPSAPAYAGVAALFTLGLMVKPMLVTLPFVLLLWDLWPLRRTDGFRKLLLEKVPLFALAAISSVITVIAQRAGGAMTSLDVMPLLLRVENASVSYARYIGTLVWPTGLTMYYAVPLSWPVWLVALSVVGLLAMCGLAWIWRYRRPYVTVGWLWFVGTLVPVIGLVQVGRQAIADRYTYLPSIGFFIILVWGITELGSRRKIAARLLPVFAGVVVAASTFVARAQAQVWRTDSALWTHHFQVRFGLDAARAERAVTDLKADNTLRAFVTLVEAQPSEGKAGMSIAETRHFIGRVFRRHGQFDDAIRSFEESIQLDAGQPWPHIDLADVLIGMGRTGEAAVHLREATRLGTGDAAARQAIAELDARMRTRR